MVTLVTLVTALKELAFVVTKHIYLLVTLVTMLFLIVKINPTVEV